MKSVFNQPLAFVDIETTGGSHFNSRVLEVGVVRVENNRIARTYQTLLQPGENIPEFITGLTGITNRDVEDAPRFAQVAEELADILEGAIFVAHNVKFDYNFLKMEFDRLGATFAPPLLCTVRLSRRLFPENRGHKLGDLITRHNLLAPSRHRAYDDAHCLWQFYQLILREFDLDTVEAAIKAQMSSQSLPSDLDPSELAKLPEGPGVYIFEDADGATLYVGKSVTVRKRVLSHFGAGYNAAKEQTMSRAVRRLRGIPTHGELSALLLESELIKDLVPAYNRLGRLRDLVTLVKGVTTANGYMSVELVEAPTKDLEPDEALLGVFETATTAKRSLRLAVESYRLCPKLLGLEKGRKACFLSQLGKCDQACIGVESTNSYNMRFSQAFARSYVQEWPYNGPILLKEQFPGIEGSCGFVIDNWCVIAKLKEFEDGTVETQPSIRRFDLDWYRIIRRFLQEPKNRRAIKVLTQHQADELMSLSLN